MKTIVQVIGRADGGSTPHDGGYVVTWNPHTEAGVCEITTTDNLERARIFDNREAFKEWRTVSTVEPVRPWDGQPNRPLTGLTVVFHTVEK